MRWQIKDCRSLLRLNRLKAAKVLQDKSAVAKTVHSLPLLATLRASNLLWKTMIPVHHIRRAFPEPT